MTKRKIIILTLILIGLIILAIGAWFVVGNSYFSKDKEQVVNIENEQSVAEAEKDEDNILEKEIDTPEWKIYRNEEYGYSIEYPAEFFSLSVYGTGTNKSFSNEDIDAPLEMKKDSIYIHVQVDENNNSLSLDEWVDNKHKDILYRKIYNRQQLIINNIPALKQIEDDRDAVDRETGYVVATYYLSGDKIYSIIGLTYTKEAFNKHEDEYNIMTESFTINTTEEMGANTPEWLTYRSEEYGFEFRYPSDWQIIIKEKKLVVNSDNYKMGLAVTMEKTNQSLNQFIESYNSIDPTSRIIKQEQISLNNRPATRLLASTSIGIDYTYLYYTTQWGINYLIKYNEFSEIHNEIISTLQLIN